MNIEQLEKKAEEIRGGYVRIQREEEEIRRQTREMQADNAQITQELETSKRTRKSWKLSSKPARRNWKTGKR